MADTTKTNMIDCFNGDAPMPAPNDMAGSIEPLNATIPADAALADAIKRACAYYRQAGRVGSTSQMLAKQHEATADKIIAAAMRALAVPKHKQYHEVAQLLYGLLDDIDTAGDIAKSDDKSYRSIVERTQAKKRNYVVSCDGYTVVLVDDSMLASKEKGGGE